MGATSVAAGCSVTDVTESVPPPQAITAKETLNIRVAVINLKIVNYLFQITQNKHKNKRSGDLKSLMRYFTIDAMINPNSFIKLYLDSKRIVN